MDMTALNILPTPSRPNPSQRKSKWGNILADSPKHVAEILNHCQNQRLPVGHALVDIAHVDGLRLQLNNLCHITHHWPRDLTVQTELGLTLGQLNRQLAPYHQCWPYSAHPDTPLYQLLIHGLTSCQTGIQPTALTDSILGITTALPNGNLINTGGRVRKNVSGYDMRPLWLGTRGAYGIPVRANVSLSPLPQQSICIFIGFETQAQAIQWANLTPCPREYIAGQAILTGAPVSLLQKRDQTLTQTLKPLRRSPWLGWLHLHGSHNTLKPWINIITQQHPSAIILSKNLYQSPDSLFGTAAHLISGEHGLADKAPPHIRLEYTPPLSQGQFAMAVLTQQLHAMHFPYGIEWMMAYLPALGRTILSIYAQNDHQLEDPRIEECLTYWCQHPELNVQYAHLAYAPYALTHWAHTINTPNDDTILDLHRQLKQQFDPHCILQHPLFPL